MEHENGFKNTEQVTTNEVLLYIQAKEIETRTTGRVDSEPDQFASIRNALLKGELSPKEAMRLVDELIASRQDYN